MASAIEKSTAEVSLTQADMEALRANGVLAVQHPFKNGIILFQFAGEVQPVEKGTDGILTSPRLTASSTERLENGETLTYSHGKLRVRIAPEEL